ESAAHAEARAKTVKRLEVSADAGFRTTAELQEAQAMLREAHVRIFNTRQALITLGLPLSRDEAEHPTEEGLQFLGLPREIAATLDRDAMTANLLPVYATQDG